MIAAFLLGLAIQGSAAADPIGDLLTADATMAEATEPGESTLGMECVGPFIQGATIICRAAPGTVIALGDQSATADAEGWAILGLDRDAGPEVVMRADLAGGTRIETTHAVEQREYDIQRIEGVPQNTVTPPEEALVRIREQSRQKAAAYTSRWDGNGFAGGFIPPADGIITGVYGSQRYYNGEPRRPHYGLDYANDAGTPVVAVADGIVTLADDDMYYEGGLIFIDHGQGFTSAFLHLSEVDVEVGQIVRQGDRIGSIGAGGRATGAHVDWRIKWRNRYIDPALALELDLSALR
ncbi:M23 family metallopeptidase [Hyphobacterium marinum]|uniref:M23 family metallopeptidase n=1 Tax=Hyphobacterium marinum TaxID=3116574 RepID=A0ABU7LXG0_9PROT|nr:M23 family metallopeptidase [Hyphobacterium sp. Y6023]MEE2565967.1 M23 family metallopeptidase [Hyphobacterium sp. Y6023]